MDYAFLPPTLREKIGIAIWGALGGFPFASQYAAVQFIPMGDFTALCSLGPILAYIVARVFLKHKFTILKVTRFIDIANYSIKYLMESNLIKLVLASLTDFITPFSPNI